MRCKEATYVLQRGHECGCTRQSNNSFRTSKDFKGGKSGK